MKTILFTGGGTAGHVTPNIGLIQQCLAEQWQVIYAGSKTGIEKSIIENLKIPYHSIATGKLRRYFSWRTFIEPFVIFLGIVQGFFLCRKIKPNVVFSKGGFVAFPIVVGAWLNRIPVIVHESDLSPGLANKLSFPFAQKICMTFDVAKQHFPADKIVVTGLPFRDALLEGNADKGREFCQFTTKKPILLILGGSLGAAIINQTVRQILPKLLNIFQVVHVCGKGKIDSNLNNQQDYRQFEYIDAELADVFACADLVVSRAGANAVHELLRLKKPHVLIPLSKRASRGDQIENANFYEKQGVSRVLLEENLTAESLFNMIEDGYAKRLESHERLMSLTLPNSNVLIYQQILTSCKELK